MKKININQKTIGILSGLFILSFPSIAGCNKKINCDIETKHAHKYISAEDFTTYRISEYETESKLFRQNEYLEITDEIQLMDQFNLLKIEDNIDSIIEDTSKDIPYVEYEYSHVISNSSRKILTTISYTECDFTSDPTHSNLTGNIRDVDYQYKAYKLTTKENGNFSLQESELVDDLLSIKNEYPYFKLDDYKVKVYSESYKLNKKRQNKSYP